MLSVHMSLGTAAVWSQLVVYRETGKTTIAAAAEPKRLGIERQDVY